MSLPKIVSARETGRMQYVPELGNILYGGRYFVPVDREQLKTKPFVHLNSIGMNPWRCLEGRIETEPFQTELRYHCPYSGYAHFWAVPVAILTDHVTRYKLSHEVKWADVAFDHDWVRHRNKQPFNLEVVQEVLMGSGYTAGTTVENGVSNRIMLGGTMDNHDLLLCWVWEWFNK